MKENKCCLLLILLLFVAFNALSQKKKTFWDSVKDVANASGISGRVIKGDWGELGAGGQISTELNTPRNHKYTFSITRDNSEVRLSLNSTNETDAVIFSEYGQRISSVSSGRTSTRKFSRAGNYHVIFTAKRLSTGTYRFEMDGPVSNIQKVNTQFWELNDLTFGEEGAGGYHLGRIKSPRNHSFFFEPEIDSYYDINVMSNTGMPLEFQVSLPDGNEHKGKGWIPGQKYVIQKASLRGKYKIHIGSDRAGDRGDYKIEVIGNLKNNPQRIEYGFKTLKGEFDNAGITHEYTIPIKSDSPIEIIYRSTTTEAAFTLEDQYNSPVPVSWKNTVSNYHLNNGYVLKGNGNYSLKVKGQSNGAYELLIWGDFDEIKQEQGTSTTKAASVNNSANLVKTFGEVRSAKASVDYSLVKVQAHDYDTGERKKEVSPDKSGKYILELEPGKKYSITVLSDGKYLASTENVDLSSAKTGETKNAAPIQLLGGDDIGKKLTLNNIFFDTGSPILLRQSYAELKRAATFLKANPHLKIEVAGHTDSVGDDASNLSLSQNRANAVLYYLQDQLDDFSRLSAKGYGKNDPVANNSSEEGRKQNRRVELRIK